MFLPFIEAISKKFKTPVTILAKKNTKVEMYFNNKEIVEEIMYLEREDNKKHSGVKGFFKLVNELKLKKFLINYYDIILVYLYDYIIIVSFIRNDVIIYNILIKCRKFIYEKSNINNNKFTRPC